MVTLVCAIIAYISYVQYPQWLVYLFGMRAGAPVISIPIYCWRMALAPYLDPQLNILQKLLDTSGAFQALFYFGPGFVIGYFVYRDAKAALASGKIPPSMWRAPAIWACVCVVCNVMGIFTYSCWRALVTQNMRSQVRQPVEPRKPF